MAKKSRICDECKNTIKGPGWGHDPKCSHYRAKKAAGKKAGKKPGKKTAAVNVKTLTFAQRAKAAYATMDAAQQQAKKEIELLKKDIAEAQAIIKEREHPAKNSDIIGFFAKNEPFTSYEKHITAQNRT